jgi:hypothetical protein
LGGLTVAASCEKGVPRMGERRLLAP